MSKTFAALLLLVNLFTAQSLFANSTDQARGWWFGKEQAEAGWRKVSLTYESNALRLLDNADWFLKELGQESLLTSAPALPRYKVSYKAALVDFKVDAEALKELRGIFSNNGTRFFHDKATLINFPPLTEAVRVLQSNVELLKIFLRLSPLIYGSNPKQAHLINLDLAQNKIDKTDIIQKSSVDLFLNHIYPAVKEWAESESNVLALNTLNSVKNQFYNHVVRPRVQLKQVLLPPGDAITELYLEEIPPLTALFRAEWTNDCSRESVPMAVLSPDVKVFYVRKFDDFETRPIGYALVLNVKLGDKTLPYILTINGTLSAAEVRGLSLSLAKMYNVDQFVVPNFKKNHWLANTDDMRFGMNSFSTNPVSVEIPESFKKIAELRIKSPFDIRLNLGSTDYYDPKNIAEAKVVTLEEQESPDAKVEILQHVARYKPVIQKTEEKRADTTRPPFNPNDIIPMDRSGSMIDPSDISFLNSVRTRGAGIVTPIGGGTEYSEALRNLLNDFSNTQGEVDSTRTIIMTGNAVETPNETLTPAQRHQRIREVMQNIQPLNEDQQRAFTERFSNIIHFQPFDEEVPQRPTPKTEVTINSISLEELLQLKKKAKCEDMMKSNAPTEDEGDQ